MKALRHRVPKSNWNSGSLIVGLILLAFAIGANPWALERLVSPDGHFDPGTRATALIANSAIAMLGILLIARRDRTLPARLLRWAASRYPVSVSVIAGLLLTGTLFATVELIFYNLNERKPQLQLSYDGQEIHLYEPYLGYRPVADLTTTGTMHFRGQHVYTATYRFDEYSRRVTPDPYPDKARDAALLVFGCSFAFGSGVNDDETIPYELSVRDPNVRVYNYAYGGWGVQHMLSLLEQPDFADQVAEERAAVLYIYIPAHIGRSIGSMRNVVWFARHFPCYEPDPETGSPRRIGSFAEAHPWRTAIYDLIAKEQVARYFHVDVPFVRQPQLEAVASLFAEAQRVFEEKFDAAGFTVVVYPEHPSNQSPAAAIIPYLRARGIRVLDFSTLFDCTEPGYLIPHDLHPSAKANRELAEAIAADRGGSN